jgi:hypothetical protein
MWEEDRPWEEKWESLKVNESKMTEQGWTMRTDKHGFGDTDRVGSQLMKRIIPFTFKRVSDVGHEFKRVSDAGHEYVSETQELVETQHLAVTQGLQKL